MVPEAPAVRCGYRSGYWPVFFIGGLFGLKQIGKTRWRAGLPAVNSGRRPVRVVVPELMGSGQKTLGLSPVSIS